MDTAAAEGKGTAYAWINTAASIEVAKIAWVAAVDRRTREEIVTDQVIHPSTTIFRQTVLFVLAAHRKVRNARHARYTTNEAASTANENFPSRDTNPGPFLQELVVAAVARVVTAQETHTQSTDDVGSGTVSFQVV